MAERGLFALGIVVGCWLLDNANPGGGHVLPVICGLISATASIVALVDTVKIGKRLNRGELVREWQWF